MFKRPLNELKTSAPLRSSDRRKLKNKVLKDFNLPELPPEESELLVPDGLLSAKFSTNLNEHGVVYLSPEGDPLWYTIGKSDDMIPTVYTLWKRPNLLPILTTPAPVIPVLIGGADLMIPGVVTHTPNLRLGQLVSVCQYIPGKRGPPLAVGKMAIAVEGLKRGAKGKAVLVEHTYKDKMWEMGSKAEPPEAVDVAAVSGAAEIPEDERDEDSGEDEQEGEGVENQAEGQNATPPPASDAKDDAGKIEADEQKSHELSPQNISSILRTSLIQALKTSLADLPNSAFPMSSSTFYTNHILPARPAFVPSPSSPGTPASTPIDIKHSSHKSFTAFLRLMEKEGLIKLKESKGKGGGDAQVVGLCSLTNPEVAGHAVYRTVGDVEAKKEKREEKEAEERSKVKEIGVVKLWKPHQASLKFFEEMKKDTSTLYDFNALKPVLNAYISEKSLVNPKAQHLINPDAFLRSVLFSGKAGANVEQKQAYKREELMALLIDKMQPWHRIEVEGKDPVTRKGELRPISIVIKLRQGRKACTLITNFEAFLLDANVLADELQKLCASSTTVTPLPAKNAGFEVMVQGSQIALVTKHLMSKGVPKEWIESTDLIKKKK